jgi:uncharacterized membrane protein YccC
MGGWSGFWAIVKDEFRHLAAVNPSDRLWQMPVAAALASGLPLLVGAAFDHLEFGLVSSLGGLVFLYLPPTPLSHRMVFLMAASFGLSACYALGLLSHFVPVLMMPVLVFIAILVTMLCRFYQVGVPGSLFFILAAAIAAYSPVPIAQIPLMVGLLTMGTVLACLIAFFYSVHTLRLRAPVAVQPLPAPTFDFVIFDSVVIGLCVGVSLALAQLLQMEKPYWVPVSCLAVIQGSSLRAVWTKKVHRVAGTGIGLALAWAILLLPLDKWSVAVIMMILAYIIETAVVRHYGFAVIFITPLTILLADAPMLGHAPIGALIEARFLDTCLGSLVGLMGGIALHSPRFRAFAGPALRRLIPRRFKVVP